MEKKPKLTLAILNRITMELYLGKEIEEIMKETGFNLHEISNGLKRKTQHRCPMRVIKQWANYSRSLNIPIHGAVHPVKWINPEFVKEALLPHLNKKLEASNLRAAYFNDKFIVMNLDAYKKSLKCDTPTCITSYPVEVSMWVAKSSSRNYAYLHFSNTKGPLPIQSLTLGMYLGDNTKPEETDYVDPSNFQLEPRRLTPQAKKIFLMLMKAI